MPELPRGTQIKDYTLDTPIGKGRYSVVYRASKDDTHTQYAIKVVHKTQVGLLAYKGTRKEALLLQNLDHPHVVRVYDLEEDDGVLYVVMELLEGGDLFDKVSELKSYTEAFAAKLARNLISVLEYLHSKGVCHRDVKPENLMLRHRSTDAVAAETLHADVVLVDFGTATKFYGYEERCAASMTDFMGTPEYMAPEVILTGIKQAVGYNEKCDIWSAGVVMYTLLCGWLPFLATTQQLLFDSILRGQFSFPPNTAWDRISPQAKDFVSKCLQIDPARRPYAAELLEHEWLKEGIQLTRSFMAGDEKEEEEEVLNSSFGSISLQSSVRNLRKNIGGIKGASKTTGEGLSGSHLLNGYSFSHEWEYNKAHRKSAATALPEGGGRLLAFADEGDNAVSPLAPSGEQPQPFRPDND